MQTTGKSSAEKLFLIDTSAPFFRKHPKEVINWSKAPHHLLEKKSRLRTKRSLKVRQSLEAYLDHVAGLGFNAVTFDELSRMVRFSFYPSRLKTKLRSYKKHYREMFRLARERQLKIFVTSDVFFFNEAIDKITRGKSERVFRLIRKSVKKLFRDYPEVEGIVFRVGESDGVDVKGDYRSRLFLKTPAMANRFLKDLVPAFERRKKTLIFRTWTIGALPLGDLLWNPKTYAATFKGIESPALIISAKYGDGDFLRYQNISRHFFADHRKKIVELQTRREYEGFGEYPSFIGGETTRVQEALKECQHLAGIQVWCQTGGWSRFRNRTFSKKSSFWNELNTAVTLRMFRDGASANDAVEGFAKDHFPKEKIPDFQRFLDLSEIVVRQLLYDPAFARHTVYFNRVRVPPLLHIFWDHVTVTDPIIALHRHLVRDPGESLRFGREALICLDQMKTLARKLKLPYRAGFHRRTFQLFFEVRRLIYAFDRNPILKKIRPAISRYRKRYPNAYRFKIILSENPAPFWLRLFIRLLVRKKPGYRLIDRILFHPFLAHFYLFLLNKARRFLPSFAGQQAMGLENFLK